MKTFPASSSRCGAISSAFLSALAEGLSPETVLERDMPLARFTTLRVGGKADVYIEPASENDLKHISELCLQNETPIFVLGRGSNLLIKDRGVRGVVLALRHKNFSQIEVAGPTLKCGAGAKLKTVAVEAKRNHLAGLEFLEGIPGSLGGALRMNAGAMGSALFDLVESIRYMDPSGHVQEQPARNFPVEYRACRFFNGHIALSATVKGQPGKREEIEKKMNQFSRQRWKTQPAAPSAGCIFKNPVTCPAGRLIDELGLKGARVGGASVSEVHGNFIVTQPNAKAQDVLDLIAAIREKARSQRGIELETEVQIVGE